MLLSVLAVFIYFSCLEAAFEEKNDILWHPAFGVYSFIPSHYLSDLNLLCAVSGTRLYSMEECNEVSASLLLSLPFARIGIDGSFFGSGLYSETTSGLTILKGNRAAFGVRMKAMRTGIRGYGAYLLGSNDILFMFHHPSVHLHTCLNNTLPFGYRTEREKPVFSFTSLVRYFPCAWYSLNTRISLSELTGTATELGSGFEISDQIWIGGGFDIQTKQISSHLLLRAGKVSLSYALSAHPSLGITHTAGVVFSVEANKKGKMDGR
jgi:hypothetical protein